MKFNRLTLQCIAVVLLCLVALTGYTKGALAAGAAFLMTDVILLGLQNAPMSAYLGTYTGVTLAKLFIPEVYANIEVDPRINTYALVDSGVVVKSAQLDTIANSGAKKVEMPLWNDLDSSNEPNYSKDDDSVAGIDDIDTKSLNARNGYLNNAWGVADLAREIGKSTPGQGNPMTVIKTLTSNYWKHQFQKRVIAYALGVFNSNVDQDGGDMVNDIASETIAGQSDSTRIGSDAVVDTVFTMGDRFGGIRAIALHSLVYKRLVKQQLIEYVRDADGTLLYTNYMGLRVVVDDDMPVIAADTDGYKYLSILFGAGAIGYGEGTPTVPAEVGREPLQGNGGGNEYLVERKTWLIHPFGFDWLDAVVTGQTPTLANVANEDNYNRVLHRKKIPLAFLVTN